MPVQLDHHVSRPAGSAAVKAPASDALVIVRDLEKSYGSVHAVRGVSFDVRRGEVFGLLGPNGAGKTTILEMVEGMLPIDRGSVTVDGVDVGRHPERVRSSIGIALQKSAFFERLTLAELLGLFADLYGRGATSRPAARSCGRGGPGAAPDQNPVRWTAAAFRRRRGFGQ